MRKRNTNTQKNRRARAGELLLKNGSFGKLLTGLCLPAMVIMVVMVVYNMADTFFIGRTGNAHQLTAISLCSPFFTILSGFGTLFGSGAVLPSLWPWEGRIAET